NDGGGEDPIGSGRSPLSLRFESCVREMSQPDKVLRRRQFNMEALGEFENNLAIIEADGGASALPFRFAGPTLCALVGRENLLDVDYLSVVAPSTRQSAYTSACAMVTYKCGLWQLTPVRTNDGETSFLEYTGLPVIDEARGPGRILFFVQHMGAGDSKAPHV